MRGPGLLVGGYVLCAALAAPAVLIASDQPQPAPKVTSTTTTPDPAPETDASVEGEVTVPTYGQAEDAGQDEDSKREPEARSAAEFAVAMRNIEFRPGTVRIAPGDTVEWKNEDTERHNAIGRDGTFETPVISDGETSRHTFKKAGNYPYFCSLHQGMNGTVKVSSSSGGGGSNGSGGTSVGGTSTGSSGTSSFGSSGSTSSLASTGEDVVWMALVGGALLWIGAAIGVIAIAQLRESQRGAR